LVPLGQSIHKDIREFLENCRQSLPGEIVKELEEFLKTYSQEYEKQQGGDECHMVKLATCLSCLRTQVAFLASSPERQAVKLVKRAFRHLQWSIATSGQMRKEWKAAFNKGEAYCEKMGATHLLSQGIWAFKAGAAGAETDLILRGLSATDPAPEKEADFMLLTEWKLVKNPEKRPVVTETAIKQAALYSGGIVHGIEIATHRFIVLVSENETAEPNSVERGGIMYHIISLAVSPPTPSVAAKR